MNHIARSKLPDAVAELRRRYPEWRLGQLISNVAGWVDQNVWDIEDEELLKTIEQHLQSLAESKQEAHT
jgi:hypothetical protein